METNNQFTTPTIVNADGSNAVPLERLPIQASGGAYDERWLQDVLFRNPSLIPAEEIEPANSRGQRNRWWRIEDVTWS